MLHMAAQQDVMHAANATSGLRDAHYNSVLNDATLQQHTNSNCKQGCHRSPQIGHEVMLLANKNAAIAYDDPG
jgi:hypothetical protein